MTNGKCKRNCPAGHPCVLDGNVDHHLHICKDVACACHSAARYAEAKRLEGMMTKRERSEGT